MEKFMTIDGQVVSASSANLAIDLHKEGKIEFLSAMPVSDTRREKSYTFRHNKRTIKLRAREARHYLLALVNDRDSSPFE